MGRAARRLDGVDSTIFAEMSALARRLDAVNLGQGFPDQDGPPGVIEAAAAALREGRNQYPPGHGVPELVAAIIGHQKRHYGRTLDAGQVTVTTGATEAIAAALLGLVDPGDEVVVAEPYYDSYRAMIQFAGATRRPVTLRPPHFRLEAAELEAAVTDRTRVLLVNTPHNPTGRVFGDAELAAIADVARRHDLVVVSDEVYEHLTFGRRHRPVADLPGMAERTVTISSAGKSFSFTGWKVGWATGPAELITAIEGAKNWLTFASGAPLQPAVAVALEEYDEWPHALAADLAERRDLLCDGLKGLGFDTFIPEATYFALSDVRRFGDPDGHAFCLRMAEEAGVVAIPVQVFYDDADVGRHLVRWAFSKQRPVLEEALERLGRWLR